ncbi:hypothetical protein ACA910_016722 [Epithemia clementina (nom. ined.)]
MMMKNNPRGDSHHSSSNASTSSSNNEIVPLFLDHAETPGPPTDEEPRFRGGVTTHFPVLLHAMLTKAEIDGYSDVCSWEPHGRAFSVHNRDRFIKEVLPMYFLDNLDFQVFNDN